jgi:hypothetical protein
VAAVYGIEAGRLLGTEHKRSWVEPRSLLVYAAREWCGIKARVLAEYLKRDTSMISRLHVANRRSGIGNRSRSYIAGSGLSQQLMPDPIDPLQQAMIDKLSAKIQLMVVPQGQNFLMQLLATGGK